jgi:hypothetical protein
MTFSGATPAAFSAGSPFPSGDPGSRFFLEEEYHTTGSGVPLGALMTN